MGMITSNSESPATSPKAAFRVPNSIVQGLTTSTSSNLNRLSAREMTVLLGLFSLVNQNHPEHEVRTTVADVAEIIEVSRAIGQTIDREWNNKDGSSQSRSYSRNRRSPRCLQDIDAALRSLYERSVLVTRRGSGDDEFERVHGRILDSFGYVYAQGGRPLDIYDLPAGFEKIDVGGEKKSIYKVRRSDGSGYLRPTAILFRIGAELIDEMNGEDGTIKFTLLARRMFSVLKSFSRNPPAIRVAILILRQTSGVLHRPLEKTMADLGWDLRHPKRAFPGLQAALEELRKAGLVASYHIDRQGDHLVAEKGTSWHRAKRGA
jgi:hypothetical protein